MKNLERRMASGKVELRGAEGTPKTIVGYGAVFNQETVIRAAGGVSFRELILPGAFRSVVAAGGDLFSLFNHDENFVLGRTLAGTLTIAEDATGLRYEATPPATRADVLESIQRGDVTGSSFGFLVADGGETWTRPAKAGDLALRTISAFEAVRDVGPVTFPAFDETTAEVRSAAAVATRAMAADGDTPAETAEEAACMAACQTCMDACAACITACSPMLADEDCGAACRECVSACASAMRICGETMAACGGQDIYSYYASSDVPTLRARLDLVEAEG
jgi:HK97 family phage prohead protease